jgi:hypothetical protein
MILFLGVFAPILSEPGFSRNYISFRAADGFVVIGCAIVAFIASIAQRRILLALSGLASFGALGVTFVALHMSLRRTKAELLAMAPPRLAPPFDKLSDTLDKSFRQLADVAAQSVTFEWGWAVLLLGAASVIAAAVLTPDIGEEGLDDD